MPEIRIDDNMVAMTARGSKIFGYNGLSTIAEITREINQMIKSAVDIEEHRAVNITKQPFFIHLVVIFEIGSNESFHGKLRPIADFLDKMYPEYNVSIYQTSDDGLRVYKEDFGAILIILNKKQ